MEEDEAFGGGGEGDLGLVVVSSGMVDWLGRDMLRPLLDGISIRDESGVVPFLSFS